MRGFVAFLVVSSIAFAPMTASADGLDLAPFARVTADQTRETFLEFWPRETDDAAYTVRDADPATSWKPLVAGESTLTLDFAPLSPRAPMLKSLTAEWDEATGPFAGSILVRAYEHCGGNALAAGEWRQPLLPFAFDPPVRAACVTITAVDPGATNLTELHVEAMSVDTAPTLGEIAIEEMPEGVRVTWPAPDAEVHHARVHYLASEDDEPTDENWIDNAVPPTSWEGPLPVADGMVIAVVPVAEDGTTGEAQTAALPGRKTPTFADSGLVEGFYGRPWSTEEKRKITLRMAQAGLGLYIYGPKNDPLHRDEWREPYPDEDIARFAALRRLGEAVGVTWSFGISPGKDMDIDDEDERATLIAKLSPFIDAGFRHFTLLMDDIEFDLERPIDGELAAEHVGLANWLREELSDLAGEDVALWFVPTIYSDNRIDAYEFGKEYLAACADLDPAIVLMWTGTNTFSFDLDAADMERVTDLTGRAPAIWDNLHATDGGDAFVGKVYAAPFESRSPDLVDAIVGLVANPSILGAVNRLTVPTYGLFLQAPEDYEFEAAREWAADLETKTDEDDALALYLATTHDGNGARGLPAVSLPVNPIMGAAFDEFRAALVDGSAEALHAAGWNLLTMAAKMATTQDAMHHSTLETTLVDDFRFPTDRLVHEGYALLWLTRWIGATMGATDSVDDDDDDDDDTNDDESDEIEDLLNRTYQYTNLAIGDRYQLSLFQTNAFRNELAFETPPPAVGFEAPEILDEINTGVVGEDWTYAPLESGAVEVQIFGLPGATVDEGTIVWTPPHAGRYHAIIAAETDGGWDWKDLRIVVEAPFTPSGDGEREEPEETLEPALGDDDDDDDDGCGC
ncbi:MAG: beta-N-acetylglucosaminidase domain-containing protein [Deltaproteobacteria bacterium]|nr:beta-N-acetylglucosaminidase domain-containing protein [Deltaproteobacteria bacterium]